MCLWSLQFGEIITYRILQQVSHRNVNKINNITSTATVNIILLLLRIGGCIASHWNLISSDQGVFCVLFVCTLYSSACWSYRVWMHKMYYKFDHIFHVRHLSSVFIILIIIISFLVFSIMFCWIAWNLFFVLFFIFLIHSVK